MALNAVGMTGPQVLSKNNKLVCMIKKKGRRRVLNMKQVSGALRKRFGAKNVRIYMGDFAKQSFKNQVKRISDCAVLISPCGSISMMNWALKRNAALIVLDYFNFKTGKSESMEGEFWGRTGWFKFIRFPIEKEQVRIDCEDRKLWDDNGFGAYRNCANMLLDPEKVVDYASGALRWSIQQR